MSSVKFKSGARNLKESKVRSFDASKRQLFLTDAIQNTTSKCDEAPSDALSDLPPSQIDFSLVEVNLDRVA